MKTAFLLFLTFTTLTGGAKKMMHMQTAKPGSDQQEKQTYTYLALGDSYTIGESVSQAGSFPYQLTKQLGLLNYHVSRPKIIAVTGWTTGDLKDAIAQAPISGQYSLVTLLIGVNNQYRGYSQTDYRTEFVQLLNTAIAFAHGNKHKVFVLSIPDYSCTPFAKGSDIAKIASEIDQFNTINQYESTKAGVNYLDITGISRQASSNPLLIAADGLHPSEKMYGLWAEQLAPMVAKELK
jgi:lysophospholipase L1-like esterase